MKPNTMPLESVPVDDHPTVSVLRAYVADQLPPKQDATVREHLADCPSCIGLVLELADGVDTESSGEDASPQPGRLGTERAWRTVRSRLRRSRRPPSVVWGLAAAAVLIAFIGLPQLIGPRDGYSPILLEPLAATRGTTSEGPCVPLPAGRDTWSVSMPTEHRAGPLTLRILNNALELLVSRSVSPTPTGGITTELAAGTLAVGTHRLQLVAAATPSSNPPGEPRLVAQFCIEIPSR